MSATQVRGQQKRALSLFVLVVRFFGLAMFAATTAARVCLAFSPRYQASRGRQCGLERSCHRLYCQTSRLFSSTNLWSIEECLEEWNQQKTNIQFVDATWFHKGERNGRTEFETGPRLPGAVHWDTGELSTSGDLFPESNPSHLKNAFPPEFLVGRALETMGVTPTTTLVVYGREGALFCPRVWYLLKNYCRYNAVKLLQGSLEKWIAKGGSVEKTPTKSTLLAQTLLEDRPNDEATTEHPPVSSSAKYRLVDKTFVENVVEKQTSTNSSDENNSLPCVMIDTRGSSFAKNGHIPGAKHLSYASLSPVNDPLTLLDKLELE
eukprot:CAMPEP_0116108088 /NCGR_PEP_ID=MMETSP0327-20121206/16581_1 /TAXON_ID=44447 /ORGANISM="Pseudo-nitzschia delicatissima, Strain B596" /LENGTH=320 /DNA_ID=CAMNT_0003600941 /DNA_START=30 /DNA_END=992 /DNA_ORIENTATION=-